MVGCWFVEGWLWLVEGLFGRCWRLVYGGLGVVFVFLKIKWFGLGFTSG